MNVIFLDFDGVINYFKAKIVDGIRIISSLSSPSEEEEKIRILADICKSTNSKVVIESSIKEFIDEGTLETDVEWVKMYFDWFKKYGIEVIGRTPIKPKWKNDYSCYPIWKEDEIIAYLEAHPEIEHFCVIDDDDRADMHMKSDLDKVRGHLVKTESITDGITDEAGLLPRHKEEVIRALSLENVFRSDIIKKKLNC